MVIESFDLLFVLVKYTEFESHLRICRHSKADTVHGTLDPTDKENYFLLDRAKNIAIHSIALP